MMADKYIFVKYRGRGEYDDEENFLKRVNEKADEGYKPCGNLTIDKIKVIDSTLVYYMQPMFKEE